MKNTLLNEFKKNIDKNNDLYSNSPTISLLKILKYNLNINETKNLKILDKNQDNSIEVTNTILKNLNLEKTNMSVLKFIFHELIGNIYDHSEFEKAYIMAKEYPSYYEFSFVDDGITIENSFKKNNFSFDENSNTIINAINGLSTKNELGFIERGTGLNNTTNIVTNGGNGSILIASGCELAYLEKNYITTEKLLNCINGTLISLRVDLDEKIDIYKYLKQIKYDY